jgi:hypothetical protein
VLLPSRRWSGDVGYLVGSYGLIVKTTNGGTSWSQQSNFQYAYDDHTSEINDMALNSIAVRNLNGPSPSPSPRLRDVSPGRLLTARSPTSVAAHTR